MSCGGSWHRTSCHVGQVSIGQVGIGPIDLGQIVLTPIFLLPNRAVTRIDMITWSLIEICADTLLDAVVVNSVAVLSCSLLYWMSLFTRGLIGFIYVSECGTWTRLAHLTFWGNR